MFQSLLTIIRELYLYLTEVIFMLKHSTYPLTQSHCTAHNTHATLQHAATSPNIYRVRQKNLTIFKLQ